MMGSELGVQADSRPEPQLGPVGIFWASWACVWTALVVVGMAYLITRRRLPLLRQRGLGLSLAAVTLLHLYWISVQLGYVVGPLTPGNAEYWIMGIYLPFGIALFHASNSRFLHVAQAQKRYAESGGIVDASSEAWARGRGVRHRFKRLDYTSKTLVVVGMGMFLQVRPTRTWTEMGVSNGTI